MRTQLLLIPAVLLTLSLSACGGGTPEPHSTIAGADPSATPSITPSAAPLDPPPSPVPAATPAEIFVGVDSVTILASDEGVYGAFSMDDPASDVVALLTDVFGAAPATHDQSGGDENPPARIYDWGGFEVIDGEGLTIMRTDLVVRVSRSTVHGVPVGTTSGLRVGEPMSTAIAVQDFGGNYGNVFAAVDAVDIDPVSVGEAAGSPLQIFTAVYSTGDASGTISDFIAPTPNWGV